MIIPQSKHHEPVPWVLDCRENGSVFKVTWMQSFYWCLGCLGCFTEVDSTVRSWSIQYQWFWGRSVREMRSHSPKDEMFTHSMFLLALQGCLSGRIHKQYWRLLINYHTWLRKTAINCFKNPPYLRSLYNC